MTSNRPQHIEASSYIPTGSDTEKPRALWSLSEDQSDSAVTKKTALSDLSDNLMEQIVDMRNIEKAWRKVKANKGARGPDGITLDEFPQSFRAQWPTIRQQLLDGTYDPQPSFEGTMQGGRLSPLLANILLDDFDKELERRGLHFVRYADDFLVFTKTEKSALRVFESV